MTNYEKLIKTFPNIPKYSGIDFWGDYWNEEYTELKEEEKPVEVDIENGITWWFFVCGECHAQVFERDNYCQQCGRRIDWRGTGNKAAGTERVPDDIRSESAEREQEPGEP